MFSQSKAQQRIYKFKNGMGLSQKGVHLPTKIGFEQSNMMGIAGISENRAPQNLTVVKISTPIEVPVFGYPEYPARWDNLIRCIHHDKTNILTNI